MEAFFFYNIKILIISALLWAAYRMFISGNTFHGLNRAVLLASFVMMLLLPFAEIPLPELSKNIDNQTVNPTEIAVVSYEIPSQNLVPATQFFNWEWLLWLYSAGLLAIGIRFLFSLASLLRILQKSEKISYKNTTTLYLAPKKTTPFSWFSFIVIARDDLSDENDDIIRHETAHAKLWHSADTLFVQLIGIVFWWNPFVWLLKKELEAVHEYQADAYTLRQSPNANSYRKLLIKRCVGDEKYALAHHFESHNLKKRIQMTLKKQSPKKARWNYAAMTLAVVLSASVSSLQMLQAQEKPTKTEKKETLSVIHIDGKKMPDERLYIIDGVETTDTAEVEKISAKDIKSVSVMTGKIATEIYGEKGKNGAISIVTKTNTVENETSEDAISDNAETKKPMTEDLLYIINGNPAEMDFATEMNPNDIESVTVLKGEAAAIAFGEKARNGAVLVTTKKTTQITAPDDSRMKASFTSNGDTVAEVIVRKDGKITAYEKDGETDFYINGKKTTLDKVRKLDGNSVLKIEAVLPDASEELYKQLKANPNRRIFDIRTK
ncbi:MAG: M56 family metallopeptidase [Capnocytophaga sp.]|nr:M56 family metallopeptidase [Capnocytophaga sp.]